MTKVVRAAGGVVGRAGADGTEVVLVHRPRYDDWSLPKGKLSPGEHPLLAAIREVGEETAVRVVPRLRLPAVRYLTGAPGVEKAVDFWVMHARASTDFVPNDEVDEVRWVRLAEAAKMLTYAHDRGVVSAYPTADRADGLVVLLRHAYAGEPGSWPGPDDERPLDATGQATARALMPLLAAFELTRVVSATPTRCLQTVEPIAATTGLGLERDDRFDESADSVASAAALRDLGTTGGVTVVCSQGKLIPAVMGELIGRDGAAYHVPKGSGWVVGFAGKEFVAADRLDPDAQTPDHPNP